MTRALTLSLILFLAGCASSGSSQTYQSYLAKRGLEAPTPEQFAHCHGYGCRLVDQVTLTEEDWAKITADLNNIDTPETEREALKQTIGTFETVVGKYTGTTNDREGTYRKLGDDQHDCWDESINTTIYLSLLEQKDLLKFHTVETPQGRMPLIGGGLGPHQTAVIRDKETGDRYAVDSWFHDGGHPAEVVPYKDWFYGWRPTDTKAENDDTEN